MTIVFGKRMRNFRRLKSRLAVMGLFAMAAYGAVAAIPGGLEKKYVGLLFDVINTTPSNVLSHIDKFEKHAPYLDGLALALYDVPVVKADGSVGTSKYTRIVHPTERWTRENLKSQIPILRAITAKPNMKESFLLVWMTPNSKGDRLALTDDEAWANFAENMATMAWLAKEGCLKGLMLDPEEYGLVMQYIHTPDDPPFEECKKLMRRRGREVFSRVFQEYPDAVLFGLWFYHHFAWWMEKGRQTNPAIYADDTGELSQYFYDGMLDVMPPSARGVEGTEHYHHSATRNEYLADGSRVSSEVLAFIAPENRGKYRSQVYMGNAHYLDMYSLNANPKSTWYQAPVNGSRLEHLRLNLEQSLQASSKYVWIYGENGGKVIDWSNGYYGKRKTWEDVIPGLTETMMLAKDPERFSAIRKAELKAKGELKNLLADVAPIRFESKTGVREFSSLETHDVSLKGVAPGERYDVTFYADLRRIGYSDGLRPESARARVVWKRDGKILPGKAVPIKVVDPKPGVWTKVFATVMVPEGAAELALDFGASLRPSEFVRYDSRVDIRKDGKTRMTLPKFRGAMYRFSVVEALKPEREISLKGVAPGDLLSVEVSMRRRGSGSIFNNIHFRGKGEKIASFKKALTMSSPRKEGVWRSGEAVVRVPEGADELYFDITAEVNNGRRDLIELDNFKVYRIGGALPKWPAEALRPAQR